MSKQTFRLVHDEAKNRAVQAVKDAQDGYIVTVSEPTRNLDQNAALWAMLTDISRQVDWYGNKLSQEEWKSVFSSALKRQKVVPGLDGGFVVCGQSTSKMTKSEFSELLELIAAFGANNRVKFNDTWKGEQ
jgi:hypothetical protein